MKILSKITCLAVAALMVASAGAAIGAEKLSVKAYRYNVKDKQAPVEISVSNMPEKTTSAELHLSIQADIDSIKSIEWLYDDLNTYVTDKMWGRNGSTEIALYLVNDQSRTLKTGEDIALVRINLDEAAYEAAGTVKVTEALMVGNEGFKETKYAESEIEMKHEDAPPEKEPDKPSRPSGGGGSGGGGSSSEQKPVTPETTPAQPTDTENTPSFSDISGHWAEEAIKNMAARNLLTGYSDGTFKPDGKVTRAEFAVIIDRMLGLDASATELPFTDVEPGSWYADAVSRLYNAGVIKGKDETSFGTSDKITNEQIAVLLKRAFDLQGITLSKVRDYEPFEDEGDISPYAAEAVRYLYEAGIINGSYNRLSPSNEASRAQVAAMIDRMLSIVSDK